MYVIIVYDVGEKRVGKMLKLCRQYLCWIQNSVLEGELSEAKLRELQMKMKAIIDLSLIHISEPTRLRYVSRMPSSA